MSSMFSAGRSEMGPEAHTMDIALKTLVEEVISRSWTLLGRERKMADSVCSTGVRSDGPADAVPRKWHD